MSKPIEDFFRTELVKQGYSVEESQLAKFHQESSNKWSASAPMLPKNFIKKVLIDQLGRVVNASSWFGFINVGCGIEFLGKCLDQSKPEDWNAEGRSRVNFEDAIHQLVAFQKYRHLNLMRGLNAQQRKTSGHFDLYSEFRCGLAHSFAPKEHMTLSTGPNEMPNLSINNGVVNFNITDLYSDFKNACEEVIAMPFPDPINKMNIPRLWIGMKFTITANP